MKQREQEQLVLLINSTLPDRVLLSQLAEEASEVATASAELASMAAQVAQKALKLQRVLEGVNPTPKPREECSQELLACWNSLAPKQAEVLEEIRDVANCMAILCGRADYIGDESKLQRWADRITKQN